MLCDCDCGSGKEASAHYYAGKPIGFDCPACWQDNDDMRRKELMSPKEWKKWSAKYQNEEIKMKTKKKYGWIFAVKGKPGVYSMGYGQSMTTIPITRNLSQAIVVLSRRDAREVRDLGETLLHVELTGTGTAKRIIGRG